MLRRSLPRFVFGLLLIATIFAPVNSISGFLDGERHLKPFQDSWEADVRAGMNPDEVVRKHFANESVVNIRNPRVVPTARWL